MSIQEQLANSQQAPANFPSFITLYGPVETGVLGNVSVQIVNQSAGSGQLRQLGLPTPVVVEPAGLPQSAEMGWLVENAQELGRYKGEWLLIRGTHLVVHSRDFAAIREAVRTQQIAAPFVYYVPTDDESNSVTI